MAPESQRAATSRRGTDRSVIMGRARPRAFLWSGQDPIGRQLKSAATHARRRWPPSSAVPEYVNLGDRSTQSNPEEAHRAEPRRHRVLNSVDTGRVFSGLNADNDSEARQAGRVCERLVAS